ncbi:efflux RND transporter periplasmic adaptor subunit [Ideonella sp. A 288]|uniref:efflux RND transporter periplasmic adaptor subunit n=1 Tax=Ideonella sp. A 288 TaxID=1962181 RepID=UPI000B4B4980|nr:HlyD family efflux transporter periplasmic adaptor subunit [Ideonella sp. A 288]
MNTKHWIMTGAVVAALGLALAWAFAPRPVEVEVASATEGRFEATVDEDGKTRLRERYTVSAPLAGQLARIALQAGDAIEAGAVVATLRPVLAPMTDERTRREQQARVETAQGRVKLAATGIERAQVALRQAENELRRTEQLSAQGFVSPTQLDTQRLARQAAQKDLDGAVQERRVAEAALEEARAVLVAVRAAPDTAAARRDFAVRAPVAGRVLRVLQPSEGTVALGTPLLEIGDVSRLEIVAELLTTDALQAGPGTPVRIERWGGPTVLEGRVRLVEPGAFTKVSALGVEEQRVNVLIDLSSPAEQWRALGDGYRVGLRLVTLSVDKALRVPASAVFPRTDAPGMAVFALQDGRARLTPVVLGARNGSEAWIRSGLAAGAQVIVYPPSTVRDGVSVRVRKV